MPLCRVFELAPPRASVMSLRHRCPRRALLVPGVRLGLADHLIERLRCKRSHVGRQSPTVHTGSTTPGGSGKRHVADMAGSGRVGRRHVGDMAGTTNAPADAERGRRPEGLRHPGRPSGSPGRSGARRGRPGSGGWSMSATWRGPGGLGKAPSRRHGGVRAGRKAPCRRHGGDHHAPADEERGRRPEGLRHAGRPSGSPGRFGARRGRPGSGGWSMSATWRGPGGLGKAPSRRHGGVRAGRKAPCRRHGVDRRPRAARAKGGLGPPGWGAAR
ncbi:hypothetical protein JD77_01180 [Micromonospora olivasterospora]|uniref:Uncharacterized protein n=1 Tax=Micromonospora olivasterospora TaxID=1880 RepID=A0A562I5D8_MICOL|nr:hypothetical protein JD77_01180 [Micromonospora olivasterospora]